MTQAATPPQRPPRWYDIKALAPAKEGAASAEIYIYGNIGDSWDENGVIAADFVKDLAALDVAAITLRINSYGGSVPDGLAIYNALRRHPASVEGFIDGVALSCASYIAMACDSLTLAQNAQLMIHAPWGVAGGNAAELRDLADVLDKYAASMAHGYAAKQGDYAACLALLSDGKDHWYTAAEAQAAGFANAVGEPVAVAASLARSFDLSRFNPVRTPPQAAAAAQPQQEHTMPEAVTPAATPANPQPFARSKEMNADVLACFKPFLDRDGIQALQTDVLADPAISVAQAQARLLDKLGEGKSPANPANAAPRIETVEDEADKARAAAVTALMVRAGVEKDRVVIAGLRGNPYRGAKLLDLARASLERAGVDVRGKSQMEIVAAAFTTSSSDFPVLLENAMHKTLQSAYATAALTWNRFCATGSVSDFRAHNRYRTGSFGNLDAVNELGEFLNKSIPDGEKASITAATKGNIINLSRQAVINDDLGAFVGLSASLGRAAARTVEADVYALLAQNSGLGPTMADTYTLFHANHSNIGSAGALSTTSVDDARVKMGSQMDVSGNDYLDLRPAVLLVPMASGGTARVINDAQYDPDTANKLQKPNSVRGLFRDVVDSPRLSGTRFYAFADPMEAPVLEVAFLDGAQDPFLEVQDGFDVDGAQYKVRLDYGVAAVDYRGAVTNAGA